MTVSVPLRPGPHGKPACVRRGNIGLACLAGLAALWLLAASRVHVNTSWSDNAWGYFVLPLRHPEPGDAVLFEPPATLGAKVPYLKTVRGLPGARISVGADRTVSVDGADLGRAKTHALDGRPLEAVAPGVIPPGHYYLHADHIDSHDSRYAEIGFVAAERILGRALALPDLPWLGLEGPLAGPEDIRSRTAASGTPVEPAPREPAGGAAMMPLIPLPDPCGGMPRVGGAVPAGGVRQGSRRARRDLGGRRAGSADANREPARGAAGLRRAGALQAGGHGARPVPDRGAGAHRRHRAPRGKSAPGCSIPPSRWDATS